MRLSRWPAPVIFWPTMPGGDYLYKNDGSGHFTDIGFSTGVAVNQDGNQQANMGVALGDCKHTERLSIVISHFSDEYAAPGTCRQSRNFLADREDRNFN